MTHDELIAALEAATGPSRELDAKIHEHDAHSPDWKKWIVGGEPCGFISCLVPFYTASIDAALTLVPEDFSVHLSRVPWNDLLIADISDRENVYRSTKSATLPIALVIAAMKARGQ